MGKHYLKCLICGLKEERENKKVKFFRFPKDSSQKEIWLKKLNRLDLKNKKVSDDFRISEKHFNKHMFTKTRTLLKKNATPIQIKKKGIIILENKILVPAKIIKKTDIHDTDAPADMEMEIPTSSKYISEILRKSLDKNSEINVLAQLNEIKDKTKYETSFQQNSRTYQINHNDINDLSNSNTNENCSSIIEDTSDSGVNCLDSESSEVFVGSFSSQNEFEYDNSIPFNKTEINHKNNLDKTQKQNKNLIIGNKEDTNIKENTAELIKNREEYSDIANRNENNVTIISRKNNIENNNASTETGKIIYRNKTKNLTISSKAPKKRVSFHEDILKNTRTDSIHIEHGFITYKNSKKGNIVPGRHSWCSNGDTNKSNCEKEISCRCSDCEKKVKHIVFRNACSDVLGYGNADVFESFESVDLESTDSNLLEKDDKTSYCSSNPSLNSGEILNDFQNLNNGRKRHDYTKSSSCDCIGLCQTNSYSISKYCYFSEPSIEEPSRKSTWVKEKKPKNSCLKKGPKNSFRVDDHDIDKKMQKFNVHELKIFDKSKMIFGTFKNIFTTDLPERGIPEGAENIQSVCEYAVESDNIHRNSLEKSTVAHLKKMSKSLDGDKQNIGSMKGCQNKFIHNVDDQLRKKGVIESDASQSHKYSPESPILTENGTIDNSNLDQQDRNLAVKHDAQKNVKDNYRNKYIVNCVSTVFEHTGVSVINAEKIDESIKPTTVIGETPAGGFIDIKPLKHAFVNIFKSIKDSVVSPVSVPKTEKFSTNISKNSKNLENNNEKKHTKVIYDDFPVLNICKDDVVIDSTENQNVSALSFKHKYALDTLYQNNNSNKENSLNNTSSVKDTLVAKYKNEKALRAYNSENVKMNPDLFDGFQYDLANLNVVLLNDKADIIDHRSKINKISKEISQGDTLTLQYPHMKKNIKYPNASSSSKTISLSIGNLLKASQSVLINRFLHDVTKNKILESSIRNNIVFANKIKEYKTFTGNLYIKGVKTLNQKLIEDLNAKIETEIEKFDFNYERVISNSEDNYSTTLIDISRFQLGIGEVPVEIFDKSNLYLLNNGKENLMKVFKLYAGYNKKGFMTPVLVFLTDKALYVRDLVENRLCNKYILKYSELDVILIGPYGNTILLSNVSRDMQQVLLAGGPHTADGFVANLELCIRRGQFLLPAVGQLTFEHFNTLQTFVRENLYLSTTDNWVYYAVINSSTETLGFDKKLLGSNLKEFLMYRRFLKDFNEFKEGWNTGFFFLRAGILYMFNDSNQKSPAWSLELSECQGVQRSKRCDRPHCFEIYIKNEILQLAAPDENVVSKWIQALVQIENAFTEFQKRQKIVGCTLIMTTNHLVTLRENFSTPLGLKNLTMSLDHSNKFLHNSETKRIMPRITDTKESAVVNLQQEGVLNTSEPNNSIISPKLISLETLGESNTVAEENINLYAENTGIEVLTCAFIKEMVGIRIPSTFESWWCILEFSCQEAGETSNDLVIFFSSSSEMQRFLRVLERLWQAKNIDLFPLTVLDEDDDISKQCTNIFTDISRSWVPLITAAIAFPA